MPPKKPAAHSASPPEPELVEKTVQKTGAAVVRKLAAHPSTAVMIREALKELDSRKGVSSQAIQSYIKHKYPTVDTVKLKHLVRKALNKGLETGTLVRPANAAVTTGAVGKFRLSSKTKELKPKSENVDPNVSKAPKVAKDGVKKPETAGVGKKKNSAGEAKTSEDPKPPKRPKKTESATTNPAPAKRPKAAKKKEGGGEGSSDATKTKVAKTTKGAKTGKAPQSKAAKANGATSGSKATGKRGKE